MNRLLLFKDLIINSNYIDIHNLFKVLLTTFIDN